MDKISKKIIITGLIFIIPFGVFYLLDILGINLSRNYLGDLPGILELLALLSLVALPIGFVLILFGFIRFIGNKRKSNV